MDNSINFNQKNNIMKKSKKTLMQRWAKALFTPTFFFGLITKKENLEYFAKIEDFEKFSEYKGNKTFLWLFKWWGVIITLPRRPIIKLGFVHLMPLDLECDNVSEGTYKVRWGWWKTRSEENHTTDEKGRRNYKFFTCVSFSLGLFKLKFRFKNFWLIGNYDTKYKRYIRWEWLKQVNLTEFKLWWSECVLRKPIYAEYFSRDCDMCEVSGYEVFKSRKEFNSYCRSAYENAEGETWVSRTSKRNYEQYGNEVHTRDRIMEAFENGRGTSVWV